MRQIEAEALERLAVRCEIEALREAGVAPAPPAALGDGGEAAVATLEHWNLESNDEEVSRPVLTLTSNAAEAVKTIAEASPELPNESGLRIQAEPAGEGQVSFDLTMVESPHVDDQVIEEAGARVFVEPDAGFVLEDKILDATVVGDRVQFSLSEQD
jgi:iron-sulfur cluster assembly protein